MSNINKNISIKTLQSEGFKVWCRYDIDDKQVITENDEGDYSLMLFPQDEDIFNKYKDEDILTINCEKLTNTDEVNVADEDTRMSFMAFGLMVKEFNNE